MPSLTPVTQDDQIVEITIDPSKLPSTAGTQIISPEGTAAPVGVPPANTPISPSIPQNIQNQNIQLSTEQKEAIKRGEAVIVDKEMNELESEYKETEELYQKMLQEKKKIDDLSLKRQISEKSLETYIYDNCEKIWLSVFGENVKEKDRQKKVITDFSALDNAAYLPRVRQIIDLYITCESGNSYIVEIKAKTSGQRPFLEALSQLIYYSVQMPEENNKMVVIATYYDPAFQAAIKKFNLPIEFILFGEKGIYKLQ